MTSTKQQRVLIRQIREDPRYIQWREDVLKLRVPTYPKVPKNIQVHHRVPLKVIVEENNIATLNQALQCPNVWDVNNGYALTQGEHYIISQMEHHKNFSPAFLTLLEDFTKTPNPPKKEPKQWWNTANQKTTSTSRQ